jgi:hypothetical protein
MAFCRLEPPHLALAAPAHAGIGKGTGDPVRFRRLSSTMISGTGWARLALRGGYHATALFEIEGEASAAFYVTSEHTYGSNKLER